MKVKVNFIDPRARSELRPMYRTEGSAGLDLCACIDKGATILPGETLLVSSGVRIHIDSKYFAGLVLPRSGLGHKYGIILGNSVGLIDSDYQGPLMVSIWNRGTEPYHVMPGDRIAQLVIIPVMQVEFEEWGTFKPTERGDGGLGSTGR